MVAETEAQAEAASSLPPPPPPELLPGYKLVPWLTWDEWHIVHVGLFSPSAATVASALRRVEIWRSRGCLPVAVDVTAAFIEAQQKDPFFWREDGVVPADSEMVLSMLYSMAIIRLVNCSLEYRHMKTGRSISKLAEEVGIPRTLVDIRHECSHRHLPSLRYLQQGVVQAVGWLKCNYWEHQESVIPDVRTEVRSRLQYIACSRRKQSVLKKNGKRRKKSAVLGMDNKASSQNIQLSIRDGDRDTSRTLETLAQLYKGNTTEVVSVLLDLLSSDLQDPENHNVSDDSNIHDSKESTETVTASDLRTTLAKLLSKEPKLLLSLLKAAINVIEAESSPKQNDGDFINASTCYNRGLHKFKNLSSVVLWLVINLRVLKDTGRIAFHNGAISLHQKYSPTYSIRTLLQKILQLSMILGERLLTESAVILLDINGDSPLKDKLKKFLLLSIKSEATPELSDISIETAENMIKKFEKKLKERQSEAINDSNLWSVAKNWTPCPIGMLPCSFGWIGVPPNLDVPGGDVVELLSGDDDERAAKSKRMKPSSHGDVADDESITAFQKDGGLLVDGFWKKPSRAELQDLKSKVRIFAEQ